MRGFLPFLILLLAVAFFTRVDLFFHLLYALFSLYFLGRLWARRSTGAVLVQRHHDRRMFLGDTLSITVDIHNRGWLPVLWLQLSDAIPGELVVGQSFRHALSLLPRERRSLTYTVHGRRRGYYPVGPLATKGGDLLGTTTYEHRFAEQDFLIVYPRIVPLVEARLPSQSPSGVLPSRHRLFEDPARIRGVRDYQSGDSLRRIDWKTSSRVGTLQVRRYEPAISLETAILLNLNREDYPLRKWRSATELGIVIAASLATHLIEKRQAVGLATNGRDPLTESPDRSPCLPLRKGRAHLMHMLDLLARVEAVDDLDDPPFLDLVNRRSLALPWGSTAIVITARGVEGLSDILLALRRRGLSVTLVVTCPGHEFLTTVRQGEQIGVQVLRISSDRDMDIWR